MKLTDKQIIFVNEYLVDLNATRAYKKAYPNVKKDSVAASAAVRMLRNVKVKNYIDEQLKKIEDESIANATEVMKYLTKVMRNETSEEVVIACEGGYAKVDKTPSEKDRLKAAELLGKRYRLFVDKVESENKTKVETTTKIDSILEQMRKRHNE
ncbi:phage terminase small subunit [Clostridium cavendishii DSM 21758]|uniref:Phage terminase small subunit n=1 Tax=Clostridium cavendishii DSM 21758 TaxID=1121302 RepID=A0A1M6K0L3_9CLOT|nr:terminase small subunit [Clostridium cavendishii]SHJ52506.1 phage terminase small subunit [Clostridium cavendishii DSM 21758]